MNKLAIVILNWNRAAETIRCLTYLNNWQTLQPEIWVVDNASADDSITQITNRFPAVNLIASPTNVGFAGGNNLALQQITADYLLLLNNDATLTESCAITLLRTLQGNSSIGVVGPLFVSDVPPNIVLSAGGRDVARYINTHLKPTELPPNTLSSKQPYSVTYVSGTVALIRGDALHEVGLFDEAYFFSVEMADWCERLKQYGYRSVITPHAFAFHDTQQAGSMRSQLYAYYILRNRFRFIQKFRGGLGIPLYLFWIIFGLAMALKAIRRGEWQTSRATILALWDGLTGRFGGQNDRVLAP